MKKITFLFAFAAITFSAHCQDEKKWTLGFYTDLRKSDTQGFLDHLQLAAEANYQIIKPVSLSGGIEYWGPAPGPGVVAGVRYYPHKNIFIRARRLFLIDSNAIGAGWKKPFGTSWNFEAMVDYYSEKNLALRVGLARSF